MATTHGFEILVGPTGTTADTKAEILQKVLTALSYRTTTLTYAATYSAGSSSVNQITLTVGTGTNDYGIRVTMDSAVVGTDQVGVLLRQLIQILEPYAAVATFAASYTAGDRAYNVIIAVT